MPEVLPSEPFDRLMRTLELRIVEVQLSRAESIVPVLLARKSQRPDPKIEAR